VSGGWFSSCCCRFIEHRSKPQSRLEEKRREESYTQNDHEFYCMAGGSQQIRITSPWAGGTFDARVLEDTCKVCVAQLLAELEHESQVIHLAALEHA